MEILKVEKRTMCTVFNSGNSHVVDHTSLQNLVSEISTNMKKKPGKTKNAVEYWAEISHGAQTMKTMMMMMNDQMFSRKETRFKIMGVVSWSFY
jgi:hypothetical protein